MCIGQGQQKAKQPLVARAVAFKPHLTAVTLNHVAHRQGCAFGAKAHGVHFPAHHGLVAHGLAGPDQVQLRVRAGMPQAQLQRTHCKFVHQPRAQVAERLQQRVAVHLQPQHRVDAVQRDRAAALRGQLALRRCAQVGAQHVLQRPAGFEALRAALRQGGNARAQRTHLFPHHTQKTLAHGGWQVVKAQHVHRRLDVGQRGAAALGQAVQQLVAGGFFGHAVGDVVEHQHKAGDPGGRCTVCRDCSICGTCRRFPRFGARLRGAHRCHLHAQQLAALHGGDELCGGARIAPCHRLVDAVKSVHQHLAVQRGVNGAANADQLGAAGLLRVL